MATKGVHGLAPVVLSGKVTCPQCQFQIQLASEIANTLRHLNRRVEDVATKVTDMKCVTSSMAETFDELVEEVTKKVSDEVRSLLYLLLGKEVKE